MYKDYNIDVFSHSIEMINDEALKLIDIKDFSKMLLSLKEKGNEELLKLLAPLAVFYKMNILQEIKRLSLTKNELKKISESFAFWGDYETPLALMKGNFEIEKEVFIRGFCLLGQNKYQEALREFTNISTLFPELAWKYIYICALTLNDELFLQKSLKNLKQLYHPDEYLVFYDLALLKEEPSTRSTTYLFNCWQMMLILIQLDIIDRYNIVYELAKVIDYEKTLCAVLFICWSAGKDFTTYFSMLEGKIDWKYLNIIKADYLMEQGKSLEAWSSFEIAQGNFPEDVFVKTGIAFTAFLEGEKIGEEALSFFSMSELIQERVQFIQREKPFIFDRYRFLRMHKKKERKILKNLISEQLNIH